MSEIVLQHGYYRNLESYRNAVLIYDATCDFCTLFLRKGDRTIDQMVQAARSGKQNIIEGCEASGTSTETEIKLVGVARASFEELLEDYRDYLRTHQLVMWKKEDERITSIRQFVRQKNNKTYRTYKTYFHLSGETPEFFCNLLITLIHQTNYLLDRQLRSLEKSFVDKGGLRERMYRARTTHRNTQLEQALSLLRELYHEIRFLDRSDLLEKLERVATILKTFAQNTENAGIEKKTAPTGRPDNSQG